MEETLTQIQFIDVVQTFVLALLAVGALIQLRRIQTVEVFLRRFHFKKGKKK